MTCVLMRRIRQGRDEHLSVLVAWVVSRERLLFLPAIPRIGLLPQKQPHADVRCVFYASVRRKQPSGVYITSTRRTAAPISLSLATVGYGHNQAGSSSFRVWLQNGHLSVSLGEYDVKTCGRTENAAGGQANCRRCMLVVVRPV